MASFLEKSSRYLTSFRRADKRFLRQSFYRSFWAETSKKSKSVSPLEGLKVLDMSRILAGPFCAMLLGDLGADVVKIERPGGGDESRRWGPPFTEAGESCYFLSANRNKRSVAVDFRNERGKEIIRKLASAADVLIENYVPGKLDRLGLGYDDLSRLNPRLVYLSLTGYGSTGKYRDRAGYDVIAASMGGLLHITGPADGDPCKVGVAVTDLATGLYAKGAILAALLQREKTGRGQRVECDLLATQVSLLVNVASNFLNAGVEGKRSGTSHSSIVPYRSFRTKDGYITVGGGSEKQFKILCDRLSLPAVATDERFETNSLRVANRRELESILGKRFAEKTNAEWLAIFEGCGIPYGPINSIREVFADSAIAERMVVSTKSSCGSGEIKLVGPAVKFSDSANEVRFAPPRLGQHSIEVLSEFFGREEIEAMIREGVIEDGSREKIVNFR